MIIIIRFFLNEKPKLNNNPFFLVIDYKFFGIENIFLSNNYQ